MEQHSRTVEYCSLHRPKASPPDQLVERPKKGAVEDDLSLFHHDTCITDVEMKFITLLCEGEAVGRSYLFIIFFKITENFAGVTQYVWSYIQD